MTVFDAPRTRRPLAAFLSMVLVAGFWLPTLSSPARAENKAHAVQDAPAATVELTGVIAPVLM